MPVPTVQREQAGEEGATLRPASPVLDALVALLEREPNRPIQVANTVWIRAGAFIPVLLEILEEAQALSEPEGSLSVLALERIAQYAGAA